MAIKDEIEKLFKKNPTLTRNQAIEKLKEMKQWRASTIRSNVSLFLSTREKEENNTTKDDKAEPLIKLGADTDKEFCEKMRGKQHNGFGILIERKDINKPDPFKGDEKKDGDEKMNEETKKMMDDLRGDFADLITDFKEMVGTEIGKIKQDIQHMKKCLLDTVPHVDVVNYKDVSLMEKTVKDVVDEVGSDDVSNVADYIDDAVSKFKISHTLYENIKQKLGEPKSKEKLMIYYDTDGDIAYGPVKGTGKGIEKKSFLIGAVLGCVAASLLVFALCWFLFQNGAV